MIKIQLHIMDGDKKLEIIEANWKGLHLSTMLMMLNVAEKYDQDSYPDIDINDQEIDYPEHNQDIDRQPFVKDIPVCLTEQEIMLISYCFGESVMKWRTTAIPMDRMAMMQAKIEAVKALARKLNGAIGNKNIPIDNLQ